MSSDTTMDWRIDAACRYANNPDAWMVTKSAMSGENETALRICRACPVISQCRAWYESLEPDMRQSVIAGGIRWNSYGQPDERPQPPPPGKLSSGAAARVLRIGRNTVAMWCAAGKLAATRDERDRWVIDAEVLREYLAAQTGEAGERTAAARPTAAERDYGVQPCQCCGRPYNATSSKAKFCSESCAKVATKARKHLRYHRTPVSGCEACEGRAA